MTETDCTENRTRSVLREVARVASVMFDGELCRRIVTDRAWKWMRDFDPDDRFSASDNYDVEHQPFMAAKKTLLRLQRLAPQEVPVHCLLWVPVPTLEDRMTVIVWNGGASRWWRWAMLHHPAEPEMKAVMETGTIQEVPGDENGVLTALAPVRDSLKEVVGFIEVSASKRQPIVNW